MEATVQGSRVRVSCKAHKALAQDDSGEVGAEYLRDFLVRHLWCDYGKPSDRNLPFGTEAETGGLDRKAPDSSGVQGGESQ